MVCPLRLEIVANYTVLTFVRPFKRGRVNSIELGHVARFSQVYFKIAPVQQDEEECLYGYGVAFPLGVEEEHKLKQVC